MSSDGTINHNTPFSDAGFDDIGIASEMFRMLRVGPATFKEPSEFRKLQEIAEFFNGVQDADLIVRRALHKPRAEGASELDHILVFVQLHKEKMDLEGKLQAIKKEISMFE